ncbi:hypothetical protein TRFO_26856 [Tritrichomonas foetus]|uniref:Uncharacterized protein n=1 Tax=Tritrichomonas foetus TaxID=1144522 RepID=A0A1J4K385_9EUKA|nr:hypothetical protein TRFO_26856 [Tritrichomonas foetus]|eukprot:OHT05434.1 hypothetical protein TRFO_26856 [Tritrichomonas foetus]
MNQTLSGLTLLYVMNSPLYSSTNLKHQQTNHFNSIKINFAGSNFYSSFGKANAYLTNIHLGNFLKSPIVLSSINNAFIYDSFVVKSGNFIAGFCKFYKIQDHSIVIQQDISVASFNNNLFFKCRADDSAILYSSGWYNYYFILKDSCFIESYSTGISDDNACLMKFFISQNNNKQFEFYQNTLVNCNSPDTNVDHGPIIKSRSNVFYRVSGGVMSLPTLEVKSIHYIYK